MDLHSIMSEFGKLPHAIVGLGPCHPNNPKRELESEVEEYICSRPYLQAYPDYLSFLRSYGGAGIYYPDSAEDYVLLTVFGFGDFSDAFSDPLDPEGFYTIATHLVANRQLIAQRRTSLETDSSSLR